MGSWSGDGRRSDLDHRTPTRPTRDECPGPRRKIPHLTCRSTWSLWVGTGSLLQAQEPGTDRGLGGGVGLTEEALGPVARWDDRGSHGPVCTVATHQGPCRRGDQQPTTVRTSPDLFW